MCFMSILGEVVRISTNLVLITIIFLRIIIIFANPIKSKNLVGRTFYTTITVR